MTHDDDQRRFQVKNGVLETSDHVGGDDVARDANDEEVAEALVEDELGRDSGIAAGENRGEWLLRMLEMGAPGGRFMSVTHLSVYEALVSLFQSGERF
jgi:hypothetical protein